MATIGRHGTTPGEGRFCPDCGYPAGEGRYCTSCGSSLDAYPDRLDRPPENGRAKQTGERRPARGLVFAADAALALAAAAVGAIILVSGSNSTPHQGSYRPQVAGALAPVVSANQKLSAALAGLDGSPSSVTAAQNAASQDQSAIVAARGGLRVLRAPAADAILSQQAQQALDQDNGYVQAVALTLKTPVGQSSSQLQTLSTGAQTALVSLDPVLPGSGDSVNGTTNLLSWVTGATKAHAAASQKANQQSTQQTTTGSASSSGGAPNTGGTGPASPGLSPACGDPNISINGSTSCGFADTVFAQYATDVQQGGASSYDVYATSAATGTSYTDDCQLNSTTQIVDCSHGSDLVQFPEWAAAVFSPGSH